VVVMKETDDRPPSCGNCDNVAQLALVVRRPQRSRVTITVEFGLVPSSRKPSSYYCRVCGQKQMAQLLELFTVEDVQLEVSAG